MAEENVPQVDEKCCLDDAKPMEITEETSMPLRDEGIQGDDVLPPPAAVSIGNVNLRRYSTGGPGKAHVQTRYRGNNLSSTHDLCKHGKRREDDLVIKPWKLVKKKNVQVGGDLVKAETLSVMRKSLGNVTKPIAKRDAAAAAANSDIVKSCDGLRVKRSEAKNTTTASDSAVASQVKKTNVDVNKASRISENKSSKELLLKSPKNKEKTNKIVEPVRCDDVLEKRVSRIRSSKEDPLKSLKNKEKAKIIDEPVGCEVVLEKTLYVVESSVEEEKKKKMMMKKSIKSVKSEIQKSPEKRTLRGSGKKILKPLPSLLSPSSDEVKEPRVTRSDPRPIRQTTSRSKTGLSEKKEIRSATLVTNSTTESKIRPKRIGLKVTPPPAAPPTRPLSFKKGKVLEPKPEYSTPASIKFKKRVVQEPKLRIDVSKRKKSLKDKREGVGKMSITNGEGKREKVVLRHRKVEAKKKLQTLFNNVIEETVNRLEEVRKSSKVKALVGAFETVISLQDDNTKTSQKKKFQSKTISSQAVEG
uniref:Calmodulin-binding domain-containing protein n=1 Tax=Noccaea caerulescens TaxID=107243 RepID=A0A1J3F2Q0_NOCCA